MKLIGQEGSTPLLAVMDYGTKFLIPHLLKFSPDLTLSNKVFIDPYERSQLIISYVPSNLLIIISAWRKPIA